MALDPRSTELNINREDLMSIAANFGAAMSEAIDGAFNRADATVLKNLSADLTRTFTRLAKINDGLADNAGKLARGMLSQKDVSKQILELELKKEEVKRRVELASANLTGRALKRAKIDAAAAQDSIDAQLALARGDLAATRDIEKKIGLTGKLVGALEKIPGIGTFINAKEIDQEMRKVAAAGGGQLRTMGVAASMVGKQLLDGLLDPLAIITGIWMAFLKVDKAATDLQRITGEMSADVSSMNGRFATTVDVLEVSVGLAKELGMAASSIMPPDQLAALAEAKNLMGLTGEEATNLATQTKLSGQTIDQFQQSVIDGANAGNKLNKTAITGGAVFSAVLKTSKAISMSLGSNPEKIGKAVVAAKALGMELSDIDNIANGLLDFESSIEAELQAQLMTGKEINLAKAREYALNNDLEGLSQELAKNGLSAAEYANMNRLSQESYAKSLGMSREQLAKSILMQKSSADLTDKQKADMQDMTVEEFKRADVQDRIQRAVEKLYQSFAPILEKVVVPMVEVLSKILSLPLAPWILVAVAASKLLLGSFTGIFGMIGKIGTGLAGLFRGGGLSALTGSLTGNASTGANTAVNTAQQGSNIRPGAGAGIKSFFTGLGEGLKAVGKALANPQVLAGLAILTGVAVGLGYALGLAAPAIEAFGKAVGSVLGGLATIITSVADGFVRILGAVTMDNIGPMLALGPALFGIAAGLGAVAITGLAALPAIAGLALLSKAAPGLVSLGIGGDKGSVGNAKEKAEEGTLGEVVNKLNELIGVVKAGGVVNLDGNKVGEILHLGSAKIQ